MSLDGPARRSDVEASAEPAVKSPSSDGETALVRAAARGTLPGPGGIRRARGRAASGRTAFMIAAKKGHKGIVEALLEREKGMRDSQNHNALLGSQEWAHRGCQKRHSSRGPHRRGRGHRAHAGCRQRRRRNGGAAHTTPEGSEGQGRERSVLHALRSKREGIALLLIEHESRSPSEKCLMQSNLAEPDRPVLAASQSPSSC